MEPQAIEQISQHATGPAFSYWPAWPVPEGGGKAHLVDLDPHACVYLPGRLSRSRAFWADRLTGETYRRLMDAGFRRSGRVVYQPVCPGCRECVPIRVPVARFDPSKTQRRCWRKNQDLRVSVGDPVPTREKFALYQTYQREWHDGTQSPGLDTFLDFLYDSPLDSLEFEYRTPQGHLLAVGICDPCPARQDGTGSDEAPSGGALSSVYFYFDPAYAGRGLGTFGALYEIQWARQQGMAYWYSGYWVAGCGAMAYKASFRPYELLGGDGQWR